MKPRTIQPTAQPNRAVLAYIDVCMRLQEPLSGAQRRRLVFRLIDTGISLFLGR